MKKVVLISGGSDGLGRALADALKRHCTVVIMSNDGPKCLEVATELGVTPLVGDVVDPSAMQRIVHTVIERFGRLDVLINNAGIWVEGPLESIDPDTARRVMEVNALGPINLTQAAIPHFKQQKSGRIINIVSEDGLRPKIDKTIYSTSKYALAGFTANLQLELAPYRVGVTGIYPGRIKHTKLFERAGRPHAATLDALDLEEVVRCVELVVAASPDTQISQICLEHL